MGSLKLMQEYWNFQRCFAIIKFFLARKMVQYPGALATLTEILVSPSTHVTASISPVPQKSNDVCGH